MKKLLLLLATIITLTAKSQTSVYHPFPTTNASWVYQYYDDFHQPTNYFGSYAITGDTVIMGTNYKKISGCIAWPGGVCESGGIRESNKVIYYRPDTASTEYVLYDFNLNAGDTLLHPYGGAICSNDTAIVMQVDSVLTSDGYHRQLWFNSFAYWIEGAGSINYLLNPCNVWCVSGNDFLVCMATDSGFTYPAGIGSCIVSIPEQSNSLTEIFVSPNPFSENLTLRTNDNVEYKIVVYDILSREILQKTFINSAALNTEQLAKGLYLYEVRDRNRLCKKGIVVKD